MNLEEFVQTSLEQIIAGVRNAQKSTASGLDNSEDQNLINPALMYSADSAPKGEYFATVSRNLVHFVDFDVAVSAESATESKGGASLKVMGIGSFGASANGIDRESTVSRVKFSVPIQLPRSTKERT